MTTPPPPNVALIIETADVYGREILHGISRYLRTHRRWSIFLDERELLAPPPDWLATWSGDGVICRPTTPALADALQQRGMAVVDLNDRYGDLGLPHIGSDMAAIGRMAAEHLLERGFCHLAFVGFENETWSSERLAGVTAALAGVRGASLVGVFESPLLGLREYTWQEERDSIARWVAGLPQPLGIVACNDVRGHHVLDACRTLNFAVPEALAVVGVDNDATFCELCAPPLSSVIPDAARIGYEAAELLDRLMTGTPLRRPTVRRIPPRDVATRQSSDTVAVGDPALAQAVRYLREHACDGLSISELLARTPISRSALERGFRRFLGHSPQEEIRRIRIRRVQQLLRETDWPLERIAASAGFVHPEYMMVQFKRRTGQTPSEWRAATRLPDLSETLKSASMDDR